MILASYIATHSTIKCIDHLSEVYNRFLIDLPSSSQGPENILHLHRTKCSTLIKKVLAPSLLEDVIADLGQSAFSLILDESTDVSTEKLLCINIRYYSIKKNDVVVQFLTLISVIRTCAIDLFEAVSSFCKSININLKNLVAIGTDGASNMCGTENSLYTHLKKN